ncbi:MAG: rhomboid family intramembrane serine protease [Myxococcaceae bacterium]
MARAVLPPIRNLPGALAISLIVVSVIVAIAKPIAAFVALAPELVLRGFVWELLSYGFIETSPMGVIFGALIIWSIGTSLEFVWGRKRLIWFLVGITVLSAIATVVLSVLVPALVSELYAGGTVVTGAMWVAYGLHVGRGPANFWGAPVTGNQLALIGVGFVFLNAAFARSISHFIPEAFGLLFTFFYMRGARPSELWLRFRSWQLQRDLDKRSAHLRSIDGGRNTGGGSDKYLH